MKPGFQSFVLWFMLAAMALDLGLKATIIISMLSFHILSGQFQIYLDLLSFKTDTLVLKLTAETRKPNKTESGKEGTG